MQKPSEARKIDVRNSPTLNFNSFCSAAFSKIRTLLFINQSVVVLAGKISGPWPLGVKKNKGGLG